ncbi:hypothetical protein HMPREF2690_00210 [Corynebacterium sp. HMSC034E11]|uniref:hypothetical protein n=1 Tax=Corynebacterium sp. HMSC034E11 TaxID=1715169 RepID=UPI0008A92A40|nr:hypothetical protein [Corynebacterium sp. HMSC034E11]OHO33901.1 hypothetical protein HMPREF2690_00210 [Corynebacterium sp. HMSC034E11]
MTDYRAVMDLVLQGWSAKSARHCGSTIFTSQFTPDERYKSIPDAVIAESILNRLVVGAEIITLEGPNMRLEANTK